MIFLLFQRKISDLDLNKKYYNFTALKLIANYFQENSQTVKYASTDKYGGYSDPYYAQLSVPQDSVLCPFANLINDSSA
jgi:hypothetical protein